MSEDFEEVQRSRVESDFAQMRAIGINAVRTYTVPPRWLLESALESGLWVMAGIPWSQHVAFLSSKRERQEIEARLVSAVRSCDRHPSIMCYLIGNEIPASIVRWHGPRRIERHLARLSELVKNVDSEALVSYGNYPSTEYLDLGFLDFQTFNVYLEDQSAFNRYLGRLHNLSDQQPLVVGEIGLDSRRNGSITQANTVSSQVRAAFSSGCAGAVVFAWSDSWYRGGQVVEDWDFGLTSRSHQPKPALSAVGASFRSVPFSADREWPFVSVVICSFNGGRTIRRCLEEMAQLSYPSVEVIVVDDGSTDSTAEIAARYEVRLIRTPNRGLSAARNTGLEAARGEIVAYIDDDAWPDPHWLHYLTAMFSATDVAAVGGPNLPPCDRNLVEDAVAKAPGGPTHVLRDDMEAEHIPGCNMAFRRSALLDLGGFDPRFRAAGDDVDICWRMHERGLKIGFHPSAIVWHRRRSSVRAFWRQQVGYGRAEALLERKWPERFNGLGHVTWPGQLYGSGITGSLSLRRPRVYYGRAGTAEFQSVYRPGVISLATLPLMPEWYLLIASLVLGSLAGFVWKPFLILVPLVPAAACLSLLQCLIDATGNLDRQSIRRSERSRTSWSLVFVLHVLQPLARLRGRLTNGLTPWRSRGGAQLAVPLPKRWHTWAGTSRSQSEWVSHFAAMLRARGLAYRLAGPFDTWDLALRAGICGSARLRFTAESHPNGVQCLRFSTVPRPSVGAGLLAVGLFVTSFLAFSDGATWVAAVLAVLAFATVARVGADCGRASRALQGVGTDL